MGSGGMAHPTIEKVNDDAMFVDKLPEEISEMKIKDDKVEKEMEATVVDGNGTETGHIIVTTIGGRNGQPKQTIIYMAERVVGQGSFGIVFQAKCLETGEADENVGGMNPPFLQRTSRSKHASSKRTALPPLFNFKPQELKGASLELLAKLIPEHARHHCSFLGF